MKINIIHNQNIVNHGFTVIEDIYNIDEVNAILKEIKLTHIDSAAFRKTNDLFAIRRFLKEIPAIVSVIFNSKLKAVINDLFGETYFIVKSIYFDKPERSNWFVAWHQDLTIAVDRKVSIKGYGPWTIKQNQFAVQPPIEILQNNFIIRIHLDDADESNGALKVIPGSHLKGIQRPQNIDWNGETGQTCKVSSGGIMIMRPLLLHSSNRTINNKPRKVIHIEFSQFNLSHGMEWAEKQELQF